MEGEIGVNDSFHFDKVPPGRYRVEVQGSSQGYVKSMQWGPPLQVDGNILDRGQRAELRRVDRADQRSGDREIGGTVSDSKGPVAQAVVQLILER